MTATTVLQRTVLPQLKRCRSYLHTSAIGQAPSHQTITTPDTRDYFYDIDQHGQLFLSGTKIRNFTSRYKDPAFLDFFYSRLKPLNAKDLEQSDQETALRLKNEGYTFISLCGKEKNYIRSQDTPIVFRELIQRENDWILSYAGTLTTPFQPNALRVDKRGYLYHPSPDPASSQRRQRQQRGTSRQKTNPYGLYSLLRSELVISQFGKSLEMIDDAGGGSYEWLGDKRDIGLLAGGEAVLGEGWVD